MRFGSNRPVLLGGFFLLGIAATTAFSLRRARERDRDAAPHHVLAADTAGAAATEPTATVIADSPPKTSSGAEDPARREEPAAPEPDLSVHEMTLDVSDIIRARPLDLKEGETESEALIRLTAELSEEIRRAIPEEIWASHDGEVSVSFTEDRKIIVIHTQRAHDWVIQWLSDRRGRPTSK